jgi:hypothetical protein
MACTCESGNEPSGSIKCGELLIGRKPVSFSMTVLRGVSKKVIKSVSKSLCIMRLLPNTQYAM